MKTTTIDFVMPVAGEVSLEFLDLQGKIITTCTDYYPAGQHSKEVTVNDNFLPGVYIYRMKTNEFVDTKLCVVR
jgi:hypothetical protein